MTRALLPWLCYAASALDDGERFPRRGSGHITGAFACYNLYETADGKTMSLGALEPLFWQRFCDAVDKPDWIPLQFDPLVAEELIGMVKALFKSKSRNDWENFFRSIDACCEPVLELEEAIRHPLSEEGNYWLKDTEKLKGVGLAQPGFPLLFNGKGGELRLPPPAHGEHTAALLNELGYSQADLDRMQAEGLIKLL